MVIHIPFVLVANLLRTMAESSKGKELADKSERAVNSAIASAKESRERNRKLREQQKIDDEQRRKDRAVLRQLEVSDLRVRLRDQGHSEADIDRIISNQ